MKRGSNYRRFLSILSHYIAFFLLVAFVITCCMMLFVSTLSKSLGITFTEEHLNDAARITFINVILLSLLFVIFDGIRRKIMVTSPIKKIIQAADKMIQGDFSVRIAPVRGLYGEENFNPIIECFNKMAQELSGTETLRTDFIANVSHELKTPLAVMQNYGTMLQKPGLSEEERLEYAKAISEASRRLSSLITNILKLNKLENQQIAPLSEEYNLTEQVCACFLQFEETWEKKQLEIETELEDDVFVKSDAEMMTLVWNNLFSNAIKFTPSGGKITLGVKAEGDYAVVQVSDTGCGISKEVGAHMFDKFYQGDTSHATQGNGLGLALVKRVVDMTGSIISVESELGKGSTFIVKMRRHQYEDPEDNR